MLSFVMRQNWGKAEVENKQVGVFMRVYRNELTMHKAIQSVLEQTYANFKYYILVSTATEKAVMEYAEKDARIVVLYGGKPEDGFSTYAKRMAAENAYITTIDADDWYEKTYLEELINCLEEEQLDIIACGNHFVDPNGNIIETRQQKKMVWGIKDTFVTLPYMYGFYRTQWGKLIKSEVCLEWNPEALPESSTYGGYGGDTIRIFSLLPFAKRAGICDKVLYNYRISPTSNSYVLRQGRLDSDAVLFYFVKNILEQFGKIGEKEERYLFLVYGEALNDTTRLLLNQRMREEERAEKLLYIYQCTLTKTLLNREERGILMLPNMKPREEAFVKTFYKKLFEDKKRISATKKTTEAYLKLLEILYPKLEGLLSIEEFTLLLKKDSMLEKLCLKQYQSLFQELLKLLKEVKLGEAETCLRLLRRVTSNDILKLFLEEKKFVLLYADIIAAINKEEWEEVFQFLQEGFASNIVPYKAEQLADLWINIAASLENAELFVTGKELKTELLLNEGKQEEALQEYKELEQLGVADENMDYLCSRIKMKQT